LKTVLYYFTGTGNCQQCYGCLQWCKKEAIERKKVTVGLRRYHHPDIKRRQIIQQRSQDK
jgi:MinD superfamily P-loop ATPase